MKIFSISRSDAIGYDENKSHIVVANNENEVLSLAMGDCCDEGPSVWNTADIIKQGDYTGHFKTPFILHTSYEAG